MCRKVFLLISLVLLLSLIADTAIAVVDPNTDPNLAGFWRFNDGSGLTAVDSSVYGRDGTLVGDPNWVTGKIDGALDFNGVSDYVVVLDYNGVLGSDPRTTMFWLKAPTSVGGYPDGDWFRSVLGWGTSLSKRKWQINLNYGWVFVSTQGAWAKAPSLMVADGTWHHVAVTLPAGGTAGDIQIYIDGVAEDPMEYGGPGVANVLNTSALDPNVSKVYISQYAEGVPDDPAKQFFLGQIDDVRIYNRDLDANEIAAAIEYGLEELAKNPYPSNRAVEVDKDVTLTWTPGDYAVSHDVYYGTSQVAVTDANTSSSEYQGNQIYGANSYSMSSLSLGETYYWRIDEVNGPSVWKGDVWQFTVKGGVVIDNFEAYSTTTNLLGTWTAMPGAGTVLALETTLKNGGKQSMQMKYNNYAGWSTAYSSASRVPDVTDWTADGIEALSLYFRGVATNDGDKFYVELEDGAGVIAKLEYTDANGVADVNAIQNENWSQWMIDLQDFVDANNVDLSDIARFAVGVGDEDAAWPDPALIGFVYIDDITITTPQCYAWDTSLGGSDWPNADLNRDCVIDFEDLGILVDNWLSSGISAAP